MNKNTLKKASLTAGILSVILASSCANANMMSNCKFYVGAGADYNYYNFGQYPTSFVNGAPNSELTSDGFGVLPLLGMKFHRNFGVEAGYSFNRKIKVILQDNTPDREFADYKAKNMYMDLMGFMPIMKNIQILGGIGIGKLNFTSDLADGQEGVTSVHNKFNWRAKVGVNYDLNKHFGLRAVATYQEVGNRIKDVKMGRGDPVAAVIMQNLYSGMKLINNLTSIGVALTYSF